MALPCPAATTQTVTLTTAPAADFTYPGTATLCAGSTGTLTPALGTGASAGTFSATPAGLGLNPVTGVIDLSTSAAGTYTVTNNIAASGSCAAATATATVTVNPSATATLTPGGATTFCAGDSVTLTAASTGTNQFLLNGQPITGATGTSLVVQQSGTYTVVNTAAGGCSDTSAVVTVTVNAVPSAAFTFSTAAFCLNGINPAPTITGAAGGTFSSTAGLTIDPTTGIISLATSTAGGYTVTYSVAGTCPASATQTLTLTAPAVATFGYPTATLCAGGTQPVTVTLGTGATAGAFTSTPAGLTLNATTGAVDLSSSAAGTYTVTNTVTAGAGCANATATTQVVVNATPAQPTITVQSPPSGIVILTSSAATGNQWTLNGTPIAGATGTAYTVGAAAQNGLYCVTATSAAGCVSTQACQAVAVVGTAALLPTSIVQLFPNPTADGWAVLSLTAPASADCRVLVLDAAGRAVSTSVMARGATRHELDLRSLPTGVYAVRLLTPEGSVVKRLVRQ